MSDLLRRIEAGTARTDDLMTVTATRSQVLAGLGELELLGLVRRTTGGYERARL
jgi:hypothetical protein